MFIFRNVVIPEVDTRYHKQRNKQTAEVNDLSCCKGKGQQRSRSHSIRNQTIKIHTAITPEADIRHDIWKYS